MTTQEVIRAARNYRSWGRINTVAFCRKRNIPRGLLTLALILEAVK